jgi:hypothetical protein
MWLGMILAMSCRHQDPEVMDGDPRAREPDTWECTAFVARQSADPPVTASGEGENEVQADEQAWQQACAALPPKVPRPCELEEPPDTWTWTRTVEEGPPYRVTLLLQPSPVPYRGSARSTVSQQDACTQAYVQACAEAGAEPGCQALPGFVDGGVGAVEQTDPAG